MADREPQQPAADPPEPHAILIPGGGALGPGGALPPWVRARCDAALAAAGPETVFVPLSGGTAHAPNRLTEDGFVLHESDGAAAYLVREGGVEPRRVLKEWASYDTIGNAFFARVTVLDLRPALRRLLVVNSAFHMPRTRAIFDFVFSLPGPKAYELAYLETPNEGLDAEQLARREAQEARGLEAFRRNTAGLRSLEEMHEWLYADHGCYAEARADRGRDAAKAAGAGYTYAS